MKEVIKFLGKKDDLVWIYPKTSINNDAMIQVDMGYQAIMVRNGEIDIPYLTGTNKVFDDKQTKFSIFNNKKYVSDCSIYFFNKSREVSAREWGTKYPIKYFDKSYKIELSMRGHGTYKLCIESPRLFLKSFKIDNNSLFKLESSIKDMVISKLSETLAKELTKGSYDLLSIHAFYDVISKAAQDTLNVEIEQYGFSIYDLSIANLTPVEEEQIHALKEAKFKATIFENEFEIVNKARKANNEDIIMQKQMKQQICTNCNTNIDSNMKFCPNCGKNLNESEFGD